MRACVRACVRVCVCVCVCEREREREREWKCICYGGRGMDGCLHVGVLARGCMDVGLCVQEGA